MPSTLILILLLVFSCAQNKEAPNNTQQVGSTQEVCSKFKKSAETHQYSLSYKVHPQHGLTSLSVSGPEQKVLSCLSKQYKNKKLSKSKQFKVTI